MNIREAKMCASHGRTPRRRRGTLLMDVVIGMFLLMLAAAGLLSLFPVLKRSESMSRHESRAVQIANRMLEHIQMLRPTDVTPEALAQLNLIDEGQTESPYEFTNVPLDEASLYSPAQALRSGQGKFWVEDLPDGSKKITLVVSWLSESGVRRQVRTGTIIGAYR